MIKVRIKKVPKARTGYQVQGALVNDVPAMGGMDYNAYIGEPKLRESKYITAVPRDEANLEAEGGETVYGDINGDGMPEHQIIKGPRHAQGGVPLSLPDDTFIFSDTRSMMIKDPEILAMFGKGGASKSFTPAELAKQYDIQKYRKILEDPETDAIERRTAELMIKKFVVKLGCLALAQESMKGFPQGIPAVAKPCMEARGLTEEDILPSKEIAVLNDQLKKQMQQQEGSDETAVEEAVALNEGNPVAEPMEQEMMSQEEMMRYGGMRRLRRAQEGMEQMAPEQGGQDQMGQIIQEVQAALERGAEPAEVVMSLLQNGVPPDGIVQIFSQLGVSPEEATGLVQQVMQQSQGGGQEEMMQGQPPMEEDMMTQEQAMAFGGIFRGKKNKRNTIINNNYYGYDPSEQMDYIGNYDNSISSGMKSEYNNSDFVKNINPSSNTEGFARFSDGSFSSEGYTPPAGYAYGGVPMAAYGMSMGGYDMPFFDIPQAAYGMSMGAGMSQNYQGRPKRIPGSGAMFNLPKAEGGIEIDATNMTQEQLERAIWDAQQKDKNAQIIVNRKDPSGKVVKSKVKSSGFMIPEGKDITDLKGFPDTPKGRVVAAQYMLIEQNLNNPVVREEIIKNTKEAINNPAAWTGKKGASDPNRTWKKLYGTEPSDDEIIKQALNHQKRNLMFEANEVDPQLFNDVGSALVSVNEILAKKYINPKTRKEYTRDEATAALKDLSNKGYTSIATMSDKMNVPLDPKGRDRVLQQASMHGYANAYKNFKSGTYDNDPDRKYAMDNFLGNVSLVNTGTSDETSMGALYGEIGNKISPLDDRYDYTSNNWYQKNAGKLVKGKFTTYGNTTAGQKIMAAKRNIEFEDIPDVGPCQCEKDKLPDGSPDPSYKAKDAQGNCPCTPVESKKCPCQRSTGTVMLTPDPNTGECPPCEEDQDIQVPAPPAEWWLQDTIKTAGAFGDMMRLKKYMPWAPGVDLETPRPTFLDPTRELAANAEQANIQTQGMAQFAGPQALSARSSSIQGQAAKNAADVLSKYNNANVNIANQFEMKATDVNNQESMLRQATAQRLFDQNTVANQQFDNAKLAMRNNLRNQYTNAITNRWKTDALNQMYPNYAVSPGVGGRMYFQPTTKTPNPQGSGGMTMQEAFDFCKKNNPNATDHSACMNRVLERQSKSSGKSSNQDAGMINAMYPSQMGGPVYEDGGYVHINSWLPFIL